MFFRSSEEVEVLLYLLVYEYNVEDDLDGNSMSIILCLNGVREGESNIEQDWSSDVEYDVERVDFV